MSAMNAEFFDAIEQIEKEKGIPRGYMQEKIQQALLTAFKRDNPDCEDNVEVIMDENKKTISMFVLKTIVEESEYVNDATQILLDEAHHYDKKAGIGDTVRIPVETKKFGRIAAQAAKQVIIQGIREAERGIIYDEFTSKEHEILTGVVTRIDPRTGAVSIKISSNSEFTEAMLSADRAASRAKSSPRATASRSMSSRCASPPAARRCSSPARTPVSSSGCLSWKCPRSSTARWRSAPSPAKPAAARRWPSTAADAEHRSHRRVRRPPRRACGEHRQRAAAARRSTSSSTARIPSSTSPRRSPRRRSSPLTSLEDGKSCRVIVPDSQLSLAIGKEGQNARLAARLTGYKIDIKPESAANEINHPSNKHPPVHMHFRRSAFAENRTAPAVHRLP